MARPTLLVLAPAILLIFFANRLAPAIQARSLQCAALSVVFPRKVSYPNSARYAELSTSYFSGQENDIIPNCVLTPVSSKDVATAIKILAKIDAVSIHAQFAIRGGGHTPFAGSANIDRGVTIDLRSLDQIIVSPDGRMASIGGGARWGQVSAKLDSMGLAVAGGRVSNTGVGGLTTGGGMSFFAPRKGWVCDNVKNYEVALANGQIVDANAQENRDLWIALRGGSNNFGVVTRFDMYTFPQGESWGGTIAYPISTVYQQIEAFAQLSLASDYDVYAAVIQSIGYSQATGYGVANILVYTKAVVNPPTFQPFTNLQPQLFSSMRLSNLTQLTDEQAAFSPNGLRETYMTTTFKPDLGLLKMLVKMWNDTVPQIGNVAGISISLNFQPIPLPMTAQSIAQGGNSLGLSMSDGPLVLCLLAVSWSLKKDDKTVMNTGKTLFDNIEQEAMRRSLFHKFKYLSYSAAHQRPIDGYGPVNKAQLQQVSKKYDSSGLFQRAVPGGFKLSA